MDTHAEFHELLSYVGYACTCTAISWEKTTDCDAAITFLAQWHPLIEPRMTALRSGYVGGS